MVDEYKLPKNLKQLNKKPLCEILVTHIDKDRNVDAYPLTSTKDLFADCMKHKRPELVAMVDEYKLPKKLKQMRKQELCKELVSISKNKI